MFYVLKSMTKIIALFLLATTFVACSQSEDEPDQSSADRSLDLEFTETVSFLSTAGDTLTTIEVAVADDDQERSQGLMDVHNLPKSKGMLFIFEENAPRSFWMANTPLPLDIMFVNEDYEIIRIHHSTQPYSNENIESEKPARYVIETNAGFSISHDIQEGMKVNLSR